MYKCTVGYGQLDLPLGMLLGFLPSDPMVGLPVHVQLGAQRCPRAGVCAVLMLFIWCLSFSWQHRRARSAVFAPVEPMTEMEVKTFILDSRR